MAKTIKFNLICDEKPVRTIEDLQNNFSIEDVLAYYHNKLLHRWLKVRGYESELNRVNSITSNDEMDIIKELISIFGITSDVEKVEESIYMLKYLDERMELYDIYEKEKYQVKRIIDDYRVGYLQLVYEMLENPYDISIIKANIAEIVSNYSWVLEINNRDLFWELSKKSSLAIMCLLMNSKTRNYYLPVESSFTNDDEHDCDKEEMYNYICGLINSSDFEAEVGDYINVFAGMTDGYWKDLEPKGKSFMIISMGDGDYVRSAGESGGDLSSLDILNQFVIVDGVDYKSNSKVRKLRYMEV